MIYVYRNWGGEGEIGSPKAAWKGFFVSHASPRRSNHKSIFVHLKSKLESKLDLLSTESSRVGNVERICIVPQLDRHLMGRKLAGDWPVQIIA